MILDEIIIQNDEENCIGDEQLSYYVQENFALHIDDMEVTMLHVCDDGSVIGSDDDGDESEELTSSNYRKFKLM